MPARSSTDAVQEPSSPAATVPLATDPPAFDPPATSLLAAPAAGPATGAGSVWASREYRALWAASSWSLVGDQLARVALTVLLYQQTGSAFWASVGGAVTLLAPVVGGLLLSTVGDRRPRRQVLVACDVVSAVLIAGMTIPGLPLPVMVVLLGLAFALYGPFNAARMALLRDVFPDNQRSSKATGNNAMTFRVGILAGALIGGAAVAVVGVRGALLLDASTFVVSAILVRLWVADRPAPRPAHRPQSTPAGQPAAGPAAEPVEPVVSGLRLVFTDPVLRTSALYAWMAVFIIAPSGVAAPYAAAHGGGATLLGLVLAVQGIGMLAGTFVVTRQPFTTQQQWLVPGAVLSCLPLVGTATDPGVPTVMVLWVLSGIGSAYMIVAQTVFMSAVPDERRAELGGKVSSLLLGVQGAGMLAVAALAEAIGPADAVAVFGAAGTIAALALAPAGRRHAATPLPQ